MYRSIAYKVLQNHCNHEIKINSFLSLAKLLGKFCSLIFITDVYTTYYRQTPNCYDEMVHFAFLDTIIHNYISFYNIYKIWWW